MTFFDVIINQTDNYKFSTKTSFTINSLNDITKMDLRDKMPPLNNFELLGSTANALATLIEYDIPSYRCSRLFIYYNERLNTDSYNLNHSIKSIIDNGFCSYNDYPYDPAKINEEPSKEIYEKADDYKNRFVFIKIKKDLKSLLLSIINNEPFIVSINVYESFQSSLKEGTGRISIPKEDEKSIGGISVVVCGFDIHSQIFIIRYLNLYLELPFFYLLKDNYSSDCFIFILPTLISTNQTTNQTTNNKIVDLRGKFPEVYNQGKIGSCTANALTAIFDYDSNFKFRGSRLFLYYNERLLINETEKDEGAFIYDGITALKTFGLCAEKDWSYIQSNVFNKPSIDAYNKAKLNYVKEAFKIDNDKETICSWLDKNEPITVGISIFSNFMTGYSSKTGIIGLPSPTDKFLGGHAVVICGYNDITSQFILRNSWGNYWGDNGYFYLPYDYITDSNYSNDLWIITKSIFDDNNNNN